MNFIESIPIALFCFAMVIIVLTMLYLLIKTFSYLINLWKKNYNNFILKKDKQKRTELDNVQDNSNPIITSVTDEHGNIRNFKMQITSSKEDKK